MVVKHVVTEQMPRAHVAYTLTVPDHEQNVRFFRHPCTQSRNNRLLRLFHKCSKKPLVCASPNALDDGRMYPKHVELGIHQ